MNELKNFFIELSFKAVIVIVIAMLLLLTYVLREPLKSFIIKGGQNNYNQMENFVKDR